MSLKCHSAFKHYEMYHNGSNGCCCGGNVGSIFNVVNPYCGGHLGFWGGFGAGIGMGLVNRFTGFFGGFGNIFSGFGNMFSGIGNMFLNAFGVGGGGYYGGGVSDGGYRSDWRSDRYERHTRRERIDSDLFADKDNKKIKELGDKINAEGVTIEQLQGYIEELEALTNTDNYDDDKYVEDLGVQQLIKQAEAKIAELKEAANKPALAKVKIKNQEIEIPNLKIDNLGDIDSAVWDALDEAGKTALLNKVEELLADPATTQSQREALAMNENIPTEIRAKAKTTFYNGYTNWNGTDDLIDATLVKAEDLSGATRPVVSASGQKASITKNSDGTYTITITDPSIKTANDKTVTYTQHLNKDGEYVFKSDRKGQEYVLQVKDGEYILKQYKWHAGYGEEDV